MKEKNQIESSIQLLSFDELEEALSCGQHLSTSTLEEYIQLGVKHWQHAKTNVGVFYLEHSMLEMSFLEALNGGFAEKIRFFEEKALGCERLTTSYEESNDSSSKTKAQALREKAVNWRKAASLYRSL